MLQIFGLATEDELHWHRNHKNKKQQPWEQLCEVKHGETKCCCSATVEAFIRIVAVVSMSHF